MALQHERRCSVFSCIKYDFGIFLASENKLILNQGWIIYRLKFKETTDERMSDKEKTQLLLDYNHNIDIAHVIASSLNLTLFFFNWKQSLAF